MEKQHFGHERRTVREMPQAFRSIPQVYVCSRAHALADHQLDRSASTL